MHMECASREAPNSYITVGSGNATLCRQVSCEGRRHGHRENEGVSRGGGATNELVYYLCCTRDPLRRIIKGKKLQARDLQLH